MPHEVKHLGNPQLTYESRFYRRNKGTDLKTLLSSFEEVTAFNTNLGTEELNPNIFNNTLQISCKYFKPMVREGNEFLKPTASQE
jgi:hypothetical protein